MRKFSQKFWSMPVPFPIKLARMLHAIFEIPPNLMEKVFQVSSKTFSLKKKLQNLPTKENRRKPGRIPADQLGRCLRKYSCQSFGKG